MSSGTGDSAKLGIWTVQSVCPGKSKGLTYPLGDGHSFLIRSRFDFKVLVFVKENLQSFCHFCRLNDSYG